MNQAASNRGTASRPSTTYPHKEAMKKKKRVMMRLRAVMLAVCCMILISGVSLVVLPMFRVKNIEVVGIIGGYSGLLEKNTVILTPDSVSQNIGRGGTAI